MTATVYYPPDPQHKPAYEEDPPILRNLPPESNQNGHSDHNGLEEEKRKVLELYMKNLTLITILSQTLFLIWDTDYRYQMLFK